MTARTFFRAAKHCADWILARIIVGVAGLAFIAIVFGVPITLAELLCKAVGLA